MELPNFLRTLAGEIVEARSREVPEFTRQLREAEAKIAQLKTKLDELAEMRTGFLS